MSRAGEFRSRVTLRKPVKTRTEWGDVVTTYEDVAETWAAVEWQSGRRYEAAAKLNAEVQGVVRLRYRTDVKADWRIYYSGRVLEILSIANAWERNAELVLQCKEAMD
jgi:SPP1 family predicted phage head-tail adaptor